MVGALCGPGARHRGEGVGEVIYRVGGRDGRAARGCLSGSLQGRPGADLQILRFVKLSCDRERREGGAAEGVKWPPLDAV